MVPVVLMTLTQVGFLWPHFALPAPGAVGGRGWPMRVSLVSAGLVAGALTITLAFAILALAHLLRHAAVGSMPAVGGELPWIFFALLPCR